jgi:hypothetical protein
MGHNFTDVPALKARSLFCRRGCTCERRCCKDTLKIRCRKNGDVGRFACERSRERVGQKRHLPFPKNQNNRIHVTQDWRCHFTPEWAKKLCQPQFPNLWACGGGPGSKVRLFPRWPGTPRLLACRHVFFFPFLRKMGRTDRKSPSGR